MAKFTFTFILVVVLCVTVGCNATNMEIPAVVRLAHAEAGKTARNVGGGSNSNNHNIISGNINLNTVVRQDEDDYVDEEVDDEEFYNDEAADEDFADDDGEGDDDFGGDDDYEEDDDDEGYYGDDDTEAYEDDFAKEEEKPVTGIAAEVAQPVHPVYITSWPTNCKCMPSKGMNSGTCYGFKNPGTGDKSCTPRPCKPKFMCVEGSTAGLNYMNCIRKLNKVAVVSTGDGNCAEKAISSYSYVPYSE